jgi:transposase
MIRIPKAKSTAIATLGVDIGKNTFHLVGLDKRGAIVLRERLSRAQIEVRLANLAPCLLAWRPAWGRITWVAALRPLVTTSV